MKYVKRVVEIKLLIIIRKILWEVKKRTLGTKNTTFEIYKHELKKKEFKEVLYDLINF